MTEREKQIEEAAEKIAYADKVADRWFILGAKWADQNPRYHMGGAIEQALVNEKELKSQLAASQAKLAVVESQRDIAVEAIKCSVKALIPGNPISDSFGFSHRAMCEGDNLEAALKKIEATGAKQPRPKSGNEMAIEVLSHMCAMKPSELRKLVEQTPRHEITTLLEKAGYFDEATGQAPVASGDK